MAAAYLGIIGVIIGALLAGITSTLVERQKLRAVAEGVALDVHDELEENARRVEAALRTYHWWPGSLETKAWRSGRKDLRFGIGRIEDRVPEKTTSADKPQTATSPASTPTPPDSTATPPDSTATPPDSTATPPDSTPNSQTSYLVIAYQTIDTLQELRTTKKNPDKLDEDNELMPGLKILQGAAGRLREDIVHLRRRSRSRKFTSLAAVLAVAAVLLVTPFEYRTDATVTAAVESAFPGTVADCDAQSGDWTCSVYPITGPVSSCRLGDRPPQGAGRLGRTAIVTDQPPTCSVTGDPFAVSVASGPDGLGVTGATIPSPPSSPTIASSVSAPTPTVTSALPTPQPSQPGQSSRSWMAQQAQRDWKRLPGPRKRGYQIFYDNVRRIFTAQ
jgi:hypothetical protein